MREFRRAYRRVPFAADARVYGSSYEQDGSIANLSLDGCFFATGKPWRTGEFLHISFYTSGMVLRGKGVVRHVLPNSGMGIKFSDVSPQFRAAISFLISPRQ
jgi:PilZ domain-containing protein